MNTIENVTTLSLKECIIKQRVVTQYHGTLFATLTELTDFIPLFYSHALICVKICGATLSNTYGFLKKNNVHRTNCVAGFNTYSILIQITFKIISFERIMKIKSRISVKRVIEGARERERERGGFDGVQANTLQIHRRNRHMMNNSINKNNDQNIPGKLFHALSSYTTQQINVKRVRCRIHAFVLVSIVYNMRVYCAMHSAHI